jgi:hypothetical protein
MIANCRIALATAALVLAASAACAEGIEPGLWKIISRTETGGVIGPPHESARCLTAEQTKDLPNTFSPVSRTENSVCAPLERSFSGGKLTWRLMCKGQLDMELSGEFNFDDAHHYTAITHTKAAMAGVTMVNSQDTLEAQWVSECK